MISSIVVEPNLKSNEDGAIYLWVRDLDADQRVPRSFRLPYQKLLHQRVDDTIRRQQQGERFVGKPQAGGSANKTEIVFESIQRDIKSNKSSADQEGG
ncbi:MAG: hypothetical protein KJP11_06485 [Gammaproteobacteria bacterium]|nr:hypothetical protein [Gammaproteobacteria bacterium]